MHRLIVLHTFAPETNKYKTMSTKKDETKVIESERVIKDFASFILPNGKRITIGEYDLDFFEKIQALPAPTKIKMMKLSEEEMLDFIAKKKKHVKDFCFLLLSREWFWRDSGDPAIIDEDIIPGIPFTQEQLLRKVNHGKGMKTKDMHLIVDFFTDDHAQVYYKDEAGEKIYNEPNPNE